MVKHSPIHSAFIPEAWDRIEEIQIQADRIYIEYWINGERKRRTYISERQYSDDIRKTIERLKKEGGD
jgi:hypothetical protein